MYFDFSQKSALLLIFFTHGVVFTGLLLVQGLKHSRKSSLWLAAFTLLCCFYIAPFMLGYAGWYGAQGYRQFLFYAPLQQLFLLGPVMYFYVQSLLNPNFALRKTDYLHFMPAALYLMYAAIIWVADQFVFDAVYFYADGRDKDFATWYQVAGFLSMFTYVVLSLRHYRQYKTFAFQAVSFAESILHRWMERYLTALVSILILRILFFTLNPEWGQFGSKFWYYFCFSILFYYIAVVGYIRAVQFIAATSTPPFTAQTLKSIESLQEMDLSPSDNHESEVSATNPVPDLARWKTKVETVMQADRLYENPGLTLIDVSDSLGITPRLVSQIVNQGFAMNFNDYVNSHRSRAVVGKLNAGEHKTKTLLALALECGFNSKSTFNRAFKKEYGVTPKDYLAKNA